MADARTYNVSFTAFAFATAAFLCAGIYHLTLKPGLPAETFAPTSGIQNVSLHGVSILDDDTREFVLDQYKTGDTVEIEIQHGTGIETRRVQLDRYYTPRYTVIDALVSVFTFVLGFVVHWRRPQDRTSLIFALASSTTAVYMIGTKAIHALQPDWLGIALYVFFSFSVNFVPVFFVHFTLIFPAVRWSVHSVAMKILYPFAGILMMLQAVPYLLGVRTHSLLWYEKSAFVSHVFEAFLFLSLAFGILMFVNSYWKAADVVEKKKLRWILLGLAVGPAPFIFLWLLPHLIGRTELISEELNILSLSLIPITITISIVKYRVMDIDLLINRGTVYAIVLGIILLLYVGIVSLMAKVVSLLTDQTSMISSIVSAVAIALFFEPVRNRVQRFVDRSFFRMQYDFREAQRRTIEDIKQCIDIHEIAELIVRRIYEFLPVERIGFFTLQSNQRVRLLAHNGYEILESHGVRFEMERLKSDLRHPIAVEDIVEPGTVCELAEPDVFRRWGMAAVFPMMSEVSEILGLLVVGKKKSGLRFTEEDFDLLSAITTQAGLAIERITLQQKLLLERAEAQRLDELNKLKSYFVSSVSHDLKTPLTSIKMYAELLRTTKHLPEKKEKDYLEIIEGECERLARLINNVLDFEKVERGIKVYHFNEVNMNAIIENVLRLMKYQFEMEQCGVTLQLSKEPIVFRADSDAVVDALMNLLSNALKYSSDPRRIVISSSRREGYAIIQVEDNGIGISSEDIKKIFEPFFRAHDAKARAGGGAGLGLANVKNIMDAHCGNVEVKSTPGRGSVFTLMFPLTQKLDLSRKEPA